MQSRGATDEATRAGHRDRRLLWSSGVPMRLLVFLFVVGTIAIVALVFFELLGDRPMPWSCPRCHAGGDEDVVGRPRSWYRGLRDQRVQCRSCSTVFKEHPNGSLVEDPDG